MPPSLRDWLSVDDLVCFVLDAVAQIDLSPIYARCRTDGWGAPAFEPAMMTALLLDADATGERSSRRIEARCRRDIAYRVIEANQTPDHATIARFRADHEATLAHLFSEVLCLCAAAGLGKLGFVALDGTKLAAMPRSRPTGRLPSWRPRSARSSLRPPRSMPPRRLPTGPTGGTTSCPRRSPIPAGASHLRAARRQLDEAEAVRQAAHEAHLERRAEQEATTGTKLRGCKPKAPTPPSEPQANPTDPDSRIMKTASGYLQGDNGRALVTEDGVILAAELTTEGNDVAQLQPMPAAAANNLARAGFHRPIRTLLADAGYSSEANVTAHPPGGPELLIATAKRHALEAAARREPPRRSRIPKHLSARDRMARALRTKRGKVHCRRRGATAEAVFGQSKEVRGARRFQRCGYRTCAS